MSFCGQFRATPWLAVGLLVVAGSPTVVGQTMVAPTVLPPQQAVPMLGSQAVAHPKLVASLPVDKQQVKGFTVGVSVDQLTEAGYMPVRIKINSMSQFSADRNFTIRFEPDELSQSPPQAGLAIDIPINVAQGSRVLETVQLIPKWTAGTHYLVRVFEDGVELKDYAGEIGALISRSYRAQTNLLNQESGLNWVHINVRGASNETTASAMRGQSLLSGNRQTTNFGRRAWANPQANTLTILAIKNVPADWRYFQSIDGILMTKEDLQLVAQNHTNLYGAIRDWVLGGGTLMVVGVQSLSEACEAAGFSKNDSYSDDKLLQVLTRTAAANMGATRQELLNQRTLMQAIANGTAVIGNSNMGGYVPTKAEAQETVDKIGRELERLNNPGTRLQQQVWSQRISAGRLIALNDPTIRDWKVAAGTFGFRQSPTLRRGVDPILGDQRVGRWLIPGVAQPPVYTFMGLLGLFVVLVGPIAYRRTTKAGRGYLMFAIAPFLALTTTLAMFTYGVVSDGFGTTARVRQLTWVDGHSGDGFDRVRATYFAGVRPSAGLRFARDAEVIEYPNYNGQSWEELNRKSFNLKGNVRVTSDGQIFDSSFLPSRAQRQFVTHLPRRQIGRLTLHRSAEADSLDPPTVSSEFAFSLGNVVICDSDGLYWSVEQLAAGESGKTCTRLLKNEASKRLGKLYNDYRPIAATRESVSYDNYGYHVRDIIIALNRSLGASNKIITDGIFEDWLQQTLQVDGDLPRNSFIAESKISEDVVSVEGAEIVQSVRYVFGSLP